MNNNWGLGLIIIGFFWVGVLVGLLLAFSIVILFAK